MNAPIPSTTLLLLEPDYMLRHTVAMTARSTGMAIVQEAPSIDTAASLLQSSRFDGLLISLDAEDQALELIAQLRQGKTMSKPEVPVAVMLGRCDTPTAMKLQLAGIKQIVLRPFKVKTLLQAIQTLSRS